MATKSKPSELQELLQLVQVFQALQEPQLRREALGMDRERLELARSQDARQADLQNRQFAEQTRQFDVGQKFRTDDSMMDLLGRLGTNPNFDADTLMSSLGELDPRVGAVVEKSKKAKQDQKIGALRGELKNMDSSAVMNAISSLTPEEQQMVLAGLPQMGMSGADAVADFLPPSMVQENRKEKKKPKGSSDIPFILPQLSLPRLPIF